MLRIYIPYEAKCQFLNNKLESVGLMHCKNPKFFINYSLIYVILMKILESITQKKFKMLIVFHDTIPDMLYMLSNKKIELIATELFIRIFNKL